MPSRPRAALLALSTAVLTALMLVAVPTVALADPPWEGQVPFTPIGEQLIDGGSAPGGAPRSVPLNRPDVEGTASGSSTPWVVGAFVLLGGGAALWLGRRFRSAPQGRLALPRAVAPSPSAAALQPVDPPRPAGRSRPDVGPTTAPPSPSPPDETVLTTALQQTADHAPGHAVRQQITRLLASAPDREALVAGAIRQRDQLGASTPAAADLLGRALAAAGVAEVRAEGEPFDPSHHHATDVTDTERRDLHDRVAETVRPGYTDRGRVLRPPEVVVFRCAVSP